MQLDAKISRVETEVGQVRKKIFSSTVLNWKKDSVLHAGRTFDHRNWQIADDA